MDIKSTPTATLSSWRLGIDLCAHWDRLYVVVAPRGRVSNIRPDGRADGHKVHPYSYSVFLMYIHHPTALTSHLKIVFFDIDFCQYDFFAYLCDRFEMRMEDLGKKDLENAATAGVRGEVVSGLRDGIPIAMGYFAVAFSLGIIAKKAGVTAGLGLVCSFFTRASAGEYGVYTLMALHAAYIEVVAMSLVANLRYMLMSAAFSQKIAPTTPWYHRVLMACCITDEVFGISINHKGYTPPAYTYSAALVSTLCWASGCAAGVIAGGLLPYPVVSALSVALYGMFIAIIMPPSRNDRNVLYAVAASFALSGLCAVAPIFSEWSAGTRTIVLTVAISAVAAWLKPVKDNDHGEA